MLARCRNCEVRFVDAALVSRCPSCGRVDKEEELVASPPSDAPLALAFRGPARLRVPAVAPFAVLLGLDGAALPRVTPHLLLPFIVGNTVLALAGAVALYGDGPVRVLRVGKRRAALDGRLPGWPAPWLPASAIDAFEVNRHTWGEEEERWSLDVRLRGSLQRLPLLERVAPRDGNALVARLNAALNAGPPALPPEVQATSGERSASLRWSCDKPVRLELTATRVAAWVGTRQVADLDTDDIHGVQLRELPRPRKGLARHQLELALRRGPPQVLVGDEVVREALEHAERELRRILRLG